MRDFHDENIACLAAIDSGFGAAGGICGGVCVCVRECVFCVVLLEVFCQAVFFLCLVGFSYKG